MSQRILNVRIRPARVALLINKHAAANDFLLAVRFLSQLWGGRYCPILPVDPGSPDELTIFRLRAFRPDFVFAQNLNDQNWSQPVYDACQPRKYVRLEPSVAEDIRNDIFHEFIHSDRALVAMHEAKSFGTRLIRPLKVVSVSPDSEWAPYCAAYFGRHHPKLRENLRDEEIIFGSTNFPEFVDLVRDFVDGWKQSWIDVGSYRLNSQVSFGQPLVPTIVLVEDVIQDLSLFWNLRMSSDSDSPTWVIPIPRVCALDPVIQEKLRDWLIAFQKYGGRPNYCVVTSTSVSEQNCCQFAECFVTTLKTTAIEHVDYQPPPNQLPSILAYEHSTIWPAELVGHRLTFTPPRPKTFQVKSSESWFVDLLKDVKTGRAVRDVHLPSSSVVPDLLNGPCPPNFLFCGIPVFGDGVDSINVRCNPGQTVVNFQIPSADEVLQEILFEAGFKPVHDEKRSSYVPTINRFGGLHAAARAFTGQPGKILGLLSGTGESQSSVSEADPDANKKLLRMPTFRPDAIKKKCQLGGKQLSGDNYLERVAQIMNSESDCKKRIAQSRFKEFSRRESPEDMTLEALLEHWADKSILVRRWRIGPCSHCNQSQFIDRLNIQKPIRCANCGNRIRLKESVGIGYALEHAVGRSLQEGIVTVALTGRFLRNMTNRGFLWLPGAKYQDGSETGDIDLLACCDGYIVMAECKSLGKSSPDSAVWKTVAEQFSKTVAVAKRCKAHLVVFASQSTEYPKNFKQQLEAYAGEIPLLLLDNNDLETGLRSENGPPLQIGSLFRPEFPDSAVKRKTSGQRRIEFGWCQFMSGE